MTLTLIFQQILLLAISQTTIGHQIGMPSNFPLYTSNFSVMTPILMVLQPILEERILFICGGLICALNLHLISFDMLAYQFILSSLFSICLFPESASVIPQTFKSLYSDKENPSSYTLYKLLLIPFLVFITNFLESVT